MRVLTDTQTPYTHGSDSMTSTTDAGGNYPESLDLIFKAQPKSKRVLLLHILVVDDHEK